MYITLTELQKGELPWCLKNQDGRLEIALCEITYYPNWHNISTELKNNTFTKDGKTITIPNGYYNVCDLNKEVFQPSAELDLHSPSGFLRIKSNKARIDLSEGLSKTLGFSTRTIQPGQTEIGYKHPHLAIYKKLSVHLDQLTTSQNIYNGMPSTLLRSVPIENEKCGGGRTVTFPVLQYKRLMNGDIPQLVVSVLDENKKLINIEYINITLHIKHG